ncbi:MAG: lysophospholipid acyltransferase family protein, partial [Pseudomonadota bacterium]
RLLGIHVHVDGNVARDGPVLLISNHISWLDIIVLSAVAPLSFIAKREVAGWPLAGTLARLQRTIFIDRTQRSDVGRANAEISERLGGNERVVLFAEGTSSDGTTVLAFNTALFAAAKPSAKPHAAADHQVQAHDVPPLRAIKVQTLAITYTHLDGLPLNRLERPRLAWYGDMSMGGHAWGILKAGRIDVRVIVGEAADLASFPDRKALAARTEADIRRAVVAALRPHGQAPPPEPVTPSRRRDHAFKARSQSTSRTMT